MLAAASGWVSLGTMAAVQADTRARIVSLPPWWCLVVFVVVAGAVAWRARLAPRTAWPLAMTAVLWLPFIPGPVPAIFLAWQGPIEGLVWAVVAVAIARQMQWPLLQSFSGPLADPRRAPWMAGGLSLAIYLAASVAVSDRLPNGDEPHYLVMTESLRRDGDVQIGNNHERLDYLSFARNELAPHYVRRGLNGQIYSVHAPGLAALVLPGYVVGGYPGASALIGGANAAAAGLAWHTAWLLTASAGAAWFATVSVFLTAPALLHAYTVFPDGPGGAAVMAGLWLLVCLEMGALVRARALLLTGLALGFLPWLHTRFSVLAGCLGLAIVARLMTARQRPVALRLALFLVGPTALVLLWFAYFWTIWGTLNPSAPYGNLTGLALRHVWPGLQGLLLDQRYGLWTSAPIYLAAVAGLAVLFERRRLTLEVTAAASAYLLVVAAYEMWWGGFGGPARFLVAALPIAVLPLATMWSRRERSRGWLLTALTVSLLILVARLTADQAAYADQPGDSPALAWAAPAVDFATVIARPLDTGSALRPARSQAAFLNDWRPAWRTLNFQWRRPFNATSEQLLRRLAIPMAPSPSTTGGPSFTLSGVAAGDYEMVIEGSPRPVGELAMRIGDNGPPIERWPLDPAGPAPARLPLHLPVSVATLTVVEDAAAQASIRSISLRVVAAANRDQQARPPAQRALRRDDVRVFFLDDRTYVEPGGFWTLGASSTSLVIETSTGAAPARTIRLQSGPVTTDVELSTGGWHERVHLEPHRGQAITLPAGRRTDQTLSIRTWQRFRPIQHDPATRDVRPLGVWVEVS